MNKEETASHLSLIQGRINELRKIEEVLLLMQLFYDIKTYIMLPIFSIKELCIYSRSHEKDNIKGFMVDVSYEDKRNNYSDSLFRQLWCSNGDFRTKEYTENFKKLMDSLKVLHTNKNTYYIEIKENSTVENFLEQISPEVYRLYMHYNLDNNLKNKEEKTTLKNKI